MLVTHVFFRSLNDLMTIQDLDDLEQGEGEDGGEVTDEGEGEDKEEDEYKRDGEDKGEALLRSVD